MTSLSIVLNVYGGVVQDVFASDPDVEVTLVDWDVEGSDAEHPDVVSIIDRLGRNRPAYVAPLPVHASHQLDGTDVAAALIAAGAECSV